MGDPAVIVTWNSGRFAKVGGVAVTEAIGIGCVDRLRVNVRGEAETVHNRTVDLWLPKAT